MATDEAPSSEQLQALLEQSQARHRAWKAEQDAAVQRLDALIAERNARPTLKPEDFDTTVDQARWMARKDVHPTWFHAAYADLSSRMERLESGMQELADSLSLLHAKLETLIVHQALGEGQDGDADRGGQS
jgi:hypothetical protein